MEVQRAAVGEVVRLSRGAPSFAGFRMSWNSGTAEFSVFHHRLHI